MMTIIRTQDKCLSTLRINGESNVSYIWTNFPSKVYFTVGRGSIIFISIWPKYDFTGVPFCDRLWVDVYGVEPI